MERKFNKMRASISLEVKSGDHNTPQVARFKYLGYSIQNNNNNQAFFSQCGIGHIDQMTPLHSIINYIYRQAI